MQVYITAILLSLGVGALYSTLASGLLLTYRSSGVINFSYGAIAMYAAYLYNALRQTGHWLVPPLPNPFAIVRWILSGFGVRFGIPNWPTYIGTGGPHGAFLSMVIAIVTTGALSLLIYFVVFRPMRHSPPLAKVIASIGIMITLQAVIVVRYGTIPVSVPESLPSAGVTVLGVDIPRDRLFLAAIGVVLAIVLGLVYRYTRFGWATEAAASSERGAMISGLSPDVLASINWALTGVLAAAMGILVAPITSLSPNNFSLYILPALAGLLLAGMRSFTVCALTCFLVAALQGITMPLAANYSWFPAVGAADGVPLIIIIIAMIFRGRALPIRDDLAAEELPLAPEPKLRPTTVGLSFAAALAGVLFLPFDFRTGIIASAIGMVLALSLVLLTGLIGQVSLMQMALAGSAAVFLIAMEHLWRVPFPLGPLIAIVGAAATGMIAGIPALRLRGAQLAIVTLAAALAFDSMVLNSVPFTDYGNLPSVPSLFGLNFGMTSEFDGHPQTVNPIFSVFVLAVTASVVWVYCNIRRSSVGRAFLAVRSNERAAAGTGISVRMLKFAAFGLSGLIAGTAGVLLTYEFQGASEPTFTTTASLTVIAFAYLGGIGRLSGAFAAGLIASGGLVTVIIDRVANVPEYYLLITGLGLVVTAIQNPEGIAGSFISYGRRALEQIRAQLEARWPSAAGG